MSAAAPRPSFESGSSLNITIAFRAISFVITRSLAEALQRVAATATKPVRRNAISLMGTIPSGIASRRHELQSHSPLNSHQLFLQELPLFARAQGLDRLPSN